MATAKQKLEELKKISRRTAVAGYSKEQLITMAKEHNAGLPKGSPKKINYYSMSAVDLAKALKVKEAKDAPTSATTKGKSNPTIVGKLKKMGFDDPDQVEKHLQKVAKEAIAGAGDVPDEKKQQVKKKAIKDELMKLAKTAKKRADKGDAGQELDKMLGDYATANNPKTEKKPAEKPKKSIDDLDKEVQQPKQQKNQATERSPKPPKANAPKHNEFGRNWSKAAFKDSPELLRKATELLDDPDEIKSETVAENRRKRSYYSPSTGGMHMAPHYSPGGEKANTTYRHEYGHFIDHQMSKLMREKRAKELGVNVEDLTPERINRNPKLIETAQLLADDTGGEGLKGSIGLGLISSSKPAKEAFASDAENLMERKRQASERYMKIAQKYGGQYKDGDEAVTDGKQIFERTIAREIKKRNQNLSQFADDYFKANTTIHGDAYQAFRKRIEKEAKEKGLKPEQMINDKEYAGSVLSLIRSAMTKDDEGLIDFADRRIIPGGYMLGHDIAGSVTANKVSQGHADDYYKKGGVASQNTETFANILASYGYGEDSFHNRMAKHLTPKGHDFAMKTLQDLVKLKNG